MKETNCNRRVYHADKGRDESGNKRRFRHPYGF